MRKLIDLTGQRFEKLIVLARIENNKFGQTRWSCQCDCGNKTEVDGYKLTTNNTKSCGCLSREKTRLRSTIHSHNKVGKRSLAYASWAHMIQRRTNKNNKDYKDYRGREITVCDRWNTKRGGSFQNFLEDMGECPTECELDRIDNSLGYFKENCRWTSRKVQCRNKRNNRMITYNGKTQCLSAWAEEYGINVDALRSRLNRGWPIEKALLTPFRKRKNKWKKSL